MSELFDKVRAAFVRAGWDVRAAGDPRVFVVVMPFDTAVGAKEASGLVRDFADEDVRISLTYESEGRNCLANLYPNQFQFPDQVDGEIGIDFLTQQVVSRVDGTYARGLRLSQMRGLPVDRAQVDAAITDHPTHPVWHRFAYKGVVVDFEKGSTGICVFDIGSRNLRAGEAREALRILKFRFARLRAEGAVNDFPAAMAFWQRMVDEGVASEAVTMNGAVLRAQSGPENTPTQGAQGARERAR